MKIPRLSVVHYALRLQNILLIPHCIVAANTEASLGAGSAFSKTLTIKLKAIDFSAFTSRVWVGARREVEICNSSLNFVRSGFLLIDHFAVF